MWLAGCLGATPATDTALAAFVDVSQSHLPPGALSGRDMDAHAADLDGDGEEAGDIDGDGDLDLILGNVAFRPGRSPANRILVNDGSGFFGDETDQPFRAPVLSSVDIELVDLDSDGDRDLIEANFDGQGYRVLVNDGLGNFEDSTAAFLPASASGLGTDIVVFDANGDGISDLFLTNFNGPDHLLLGRGLR